jgi:signal peptide peptidase SppA
MEKTYSILAIADGMASHFHAMEAKTMEAMSSDKEAPESDLLTIHEGVGLIEVKGALTNEDSPYNRWYGLISYNQIRAAAVEAIDMGVGALLFDIDSPGGRVSGMKDLSTFITSLDIPTISHTSNQMASAAYFTGISCEHCFSDSMAEVGSIGVVMTLVERTDAMKMAGYSAEVFRSGKFKQVGNPNEKLTKERKAYVQGQVMTYAEKFYDFVSEHRGIPRPAMSEIETGRTFIGEEALSAGLVDKILSFDEALAFSMVLANKTLDNSRTTGDYYYNSHILKGSSTEQGDTTMAKQYSKAHMAGLVAAAAAAGTGVVNPPSVEEPVVPVKPAEPNASEESGEEVSKEAQELLELQEKFDASQVELTELTSKLEAAEATVASSAEAFKEASADKDAEHAKELSAFKDIIIAQINTMRTALALSNVSMDSWKAEAVLAEYNAVSETFSNSLPVGGVVPAEGREVAKEPITREEKNAFDKLW